MIMSPDAAVIETYPGAQSAARAVALLKSFDDARPEWTLGELSERLGLNKTTTHRLLAVLEGEGLIERSNGGAYKLGPELIALVAVLAWVFWPKPALVQADVTPPPVVGSNADDVSQQRRQDVIKEIEDKLPEIEDGDPTWLVVEPNLTFNLLIGAMRADWRTIVRKGPD